MCAPLRLDIERVEDYNKQNKIYWKDVLRIIRVTLRLLPRVKLFLLFVMTGTTSRTCSLDFQPGEFSHVIYSSLASLSSRSIRFSLQDRSDWIQRLAICILLSSTILILQVSQTIYVMDSKMETFCSCSLPALTLQPCPSKHRRSQASAPEESSKIGAILP